MKKYRGIRYAFRPRSYWIDTTVEQAVLRGVKGTHRRELLTQALANGEMDRVDERLQATEVSDAIRVGLGRIHPSLMAGEYLPGCDPGETEIARIELQSTTGDVFSIRARRQDGRIHYRVVDECESVFRFKPESSKLPFTLAELIQFIDGIEDVAWDSLADGPFSLFYNERNAEDCSERRRLREFTSISSDIYRQLHQHFEHVFEEWALEGEEEERRLMAEAAVKARLKAELEAKKAQKHEEACRRWRNKRIVRKLVGLGYTPQAPEDLGRCARDAYDRLHLDALRLIRTLGFTAPGDWWNDPLQNRDATRLQALCCIADVNVSFKKFIWTNAYNAETPLTLTLKAGWVEGARILLQAGAATVGVIQSNYPRHQPVYHDIEALMKSAGLEVGTPAQQPMDVA